MLERNKPMKKYHPLLVTLQLVLVPLLMLSLFMDGKDKSITFS